MSTEQILTFTVTIKYESADDQELNLCPQSAAENLKEAIHNERLNGALTPLNICASDVVVSLN